MVDPMPMTPASAFSMNAFDWNNVKRDAIIFMAPIVLIYVTGVLGLIQEPGHLFALKDLLPSSLTVTAVFVYVLNTVTNIVKKYVA